MKKLKKIIIVTILGIFVSITGCEKLEVENLNNPDQTTVLANPEDIRSVAGGALNVWFTRSRSWSIYNSLQFALQVMSDNHTCSWGNFAMQDMSWEPRKAWDNSAAAPDRDCTYSMWYGMYSAISQVNDVLSILEEGTDIGEDSEMIKAICHFVQGASLATIALTFDQGFVVDETSDLTKLELQNYEEVMTAAIGYLDKCIAICEDPANNFTFDASWLNGQAYTNTEFGALANSFAARFMIQGSRTAAADAALDWTKVLQYANKGTNNGFYVSLTGFSFDGALWYDDPQYYLNQPTWGRVDCRIINLMDPQYPAQYPADGSVPTVHNGDGEAISNDARLLSDFQFLSANNFRSERGFWHYSHYRSSRFDDIVAGGGDSWEMRPAENDLMKAEALIKANGDVAGAIAILNAGTRSSRGGLADIPSSATENEVLDWIFYERAIELFGVGYGIGWTDMRRRDMLQKGSLLHFPLPAEELQVLEMPNYTFGGVANADGISTSIGGWF